MLRPHLSAIAWTRSFPVSSIDGLTLPTSYVIRYDVEGQRMAHQRYTNSFTEIINNVSLDPRNFDIK